MRCLDTVILLVLNLVVVSNAHRGCCHPERMSGQVLLFEENRMIYFAVDYKAGRFFRTLDPERKSYSIIDIGGQKQYNFHADGSCSVRDEPHSGRFTQCIDEENNRGTYQVGEENKSLFIDAFTYEFLGQTYWRTVLFERNDCVPFTVQISSPSVNQTFLYSNVQPIIDFREIHSPFTDCQPERRRHLYDYYDYDYYYDYLV